MFCGGISRGESLMSYQFISLELNEGVAEVTLNRPDVLNSFHREMSSELLEVLSVCKEDSGIRAVLLTGSGRGFCAGQDLEAVLPKEGQEPEQLGSIVHDCYNPIVKAIRLLEKPVVCAVNGVAAGAGANLALCCDVVVASEKASFIQSFVNVGLVPDTGGTYFLPRIVGMPRAAAMMMLGDKIKAEQALDFGMIYKVFSVESLVEEAKTLARHLAKMPTKGIGMTKRLLNASYSNSLDEQLDLEEELQTVAGNSLDYQEGVDAFLNKRAPVFQGK
jgi:2-(1,2-epoxy-1,2-dihydrophenyl)acetyl-CoA isomerase